MKDWEKIIKECYVELYNNSEPKADFNELVRIAKETNNKDARGDYVIPFDDYEIEKEKMDSIIFSIIRKHRIRGFDKQMFINTILLGCSPKTKKI